MKRLFDLTSALLTFIVISPIFLLIMLLIKATSPGPILFRQKRVGRNNKEFIIYKFRTMKVDTPNVATHLLSNPEQYITSIGKFLRKTSLDELPQLLNIIKGDMSVVGPRPALYNQRDLNELRTQYGVHKLIPGLTGWAQINGRDELSIEDKVKFDVEYLDKSSFFFDMKIIFMTIVKVFKSEGVVEGTRERNMTM